ncbi:hypothetical protein N7G274_004364 [Stereocaulon virgatum]|uniref:Uncharacterized protein n=1 Tax=Stereocaulon virgatum TaxID=373712 RepID=A0ABR4AA01_9LECA
MWSHVYYVPPIAYAFRVRPVHIHQTFNVHDPIVEVCGAIANSLDGMKRSATPLEFVVFERTLGRQPFCRSAVCLLRSPENTEKVVGLFNVKGTNFQHPC